MQIQLYGELGLAVFSGWGLLGSERPSRQPGLSSSVLELLNNPWMKKQKEDV